LYFIFTKSKIQARLVSESAPTPIKIGIHLVWVQCRGYRCLAYVDATGKWINFYTGKKLADFVEVIR